MGQNQTIKYSIEVDGAPALKSVADGLSEIAAAGGPAGDQATALLEKLKDFASQDTLIKQFVADKAALADLGDQMNATGLKLNTLKDQFAATTTPSAALTRSIANTEASLTSLSTQFGAQEAQLARTGNALEAAGVSTEKLDSAQRAVQSSIAGVATEAGALGASMGTTAEATEAAGVEAEKTGGLFATLSHNLGQIVTIAAAVALALKAIQFADTSIKGAEDVEASLARVQALAAGAAGQFSELDKSVEQAAIAVNTTTTNAAAGLSALVSQGLSAQDAMAALIPTLELAKIANIDVGTAAGDVATVLKSFNIPATEAATVVDQLTQASHGAAGGLGAMSEAIGQLAPDAKTLGLSFTDITSILGLLSQNGIAVGNSVRGLRTIFQDLENPVSTLRGDLLALGDGTNNFGKAITALNSGTPQAQQALTGLAGPARALVEALGQAGPAALANFSAGLQNAAGAASQVSNTLDNTLSGSFSKFTNAIDLVGEKLAAPILKPFADEFSKLAGQLNDFAESDDFAAIEDSVSKMATDTAKALDGLITGTDWKGFAANAESSLSGLSKTLSALADSASTVATVVGKTADTIGVAYHGLAVGVDAAVGGIAKGASGLEALSESLASSVVGTQKAATFFNGLSTAIASLGDAATEKAKENISAVSEDLDALAGSSDDAATAVTKQGDASAAAAPQIQQHADATKAAADATTAIIDPLKVVPNYFSAAGDAASDAAPGIESLRTEVQKLGGGPLQDAQQALLKAAAAFATLQTSSDATPEAIEQARAAFVAAAADLAKLQAQAQGAGGALDTAFHNLGIVSQASLQQSIKNAQTFFDDIKAGSDQSVSGIADVANAFLAMAAKQLAAAAQLDSATQESVKESLETQADALGLSDKLQVLENQASKTGTALDNVGSSKATAGLKDVSDAADKTKDSLSTLGDEAKDAAQQLDDVSSDGGSSLADLDNALQNTRQQLLNVSAAAAAAFDAKLPADFFDAFDSTGIGFAKVIDGMNEAAASVTSEITDQRTQLQGEIADINSLGTAGSTNFGQFGDSAEAAAAKMTSLAQLIASGSYDAGLLGQQELQPLQAALTAAAQRAQDLVTATQSANSQLEDLNNQLLDAIDEATGNAQDQEDRRFTQQLQQIQDLYQQAGKLGTDAYNQAVANANKLHALNLQQIEQENAAKNDGSSGGTSTSGASSSSTSSSASNGGLGDGSSNFNTGTNAAGLGGQVPPVQITFSGPVIGSDPESLTKYLLPQITTQLKALQARTTGPLFGR